MASSTRTERLLLRVTPEFKAYVEKEAGRADLSLSEYIETLVQQEVEAQACFRESDWTQEDHAAAVAILAAGPQPETSLAKQIRELYDRIVIEDNTGPLRLKF